MDTLGPLLIAYAIGCVSFADIVGRLKGVDVRRHGSGNPGATNVGRLLGPAWGRVVLVLDIVKGYAPTMLLAVPPWRWDAGGHVSIALAVVVGHVAPISSRFRGGKGVATMIGAFLALDARVALVAMLVHLGVKLATGYVSIASVVMAWAFPRAGPPGPAAGRPRP